MKSAAQQKDAARAAPKATVKELTLTVTVDEANNIVAALAELPAKFSMNLIGKLQQQAAAQIRAVETPP